MSEPWKRKEVIGDCTLYLGDCTRILPQLPGSFDLVTDPPYGIGASSMSLGKWRTSRMKKSDWDAEAPSDEVFTLLSGLSQRSIIWGGNYFALPPSRGYLIWDKGAGFKGRDFAECEFAWVSMDMNARVLSYDPLARGAYRNKQHPTQKPLAVMAWCLSFIPRGGVVLDPFMGSGTTGVACAAHGRPFVGIELDESYFSIACERIATEYRQTNMFVAPPAPPAQPLYHATSLFDEEVDGE